MSSTSRCCSIFIFEFENQESSHGQLLSDSNKLICWAFYLLFLLYMDYWIISVFLPHKHKIWGRHIRAQNQQKFLSLCSWYAKEGKYIINTTKEFHNLLNKVKYSEKSLQIKARVSMEGFIKNSCYCLQKLRKPLTQVSVWMTLSTKVVSIQI